MSARWNLGKRDFHLGKLARHGAMFAAGLAVAALDKLPDVNMGKWTPVIGAGAAFLAHMLSQVLTNEAEKPTADTDVN